MVSILERTLPLYIALSFPQSLSRTVNVILFLYEYA